MMRIRTPDQVLYAICNMEIYTNTLKKLENKVLSVLENMGLNHHIYHKNNYNNVKLCDSLFF
jgi:hypothetical protein